MKNLWIKGFDQLPVFGDANDAGTKELRGEPNNSAMQESKCKCEPNWNEVNWPCFLERNPNAENCFCKNWNCAKEALLGMCDMIQNPFVKCTINCVLKLGDALHDKICLNIPEKPQ